MFVMENGDKFVARPGGCQSNFLCSDGRLGFRARRILIRVLPILRDCDYFGVVGIRTGFGGSIVGTPSSRSAVDNLFCCFRRRDAERLI
jgi:hypothetical protein